MEANPGYILDLPAGRHQGGARGLPGGGGRQVDPQQVGDSLPSLAVSQLWGHQGHTGSLPGLEITVSQLRTRILSTRDQQVGNKS